MPCVPVVAVVVVHGGETKVEDRGGTIRVYM